MQRSLLCPLLLNPLSKAWPLTLTEYLDYNQAWTFPLKIRISPGNAAELSTDKIEKCLAPMPGTEPWTPKLQVQCANCAAAQSKIIQLGILADDMSSKL